MRFGFDGDPLERTTDAGEPKGTAGLPILREIQSRDLTNCTVIVTRFFGGTKLGTGGLVRAYGECAGLSLDAAQIVEKKILVRLRVESSFDDIGSIYHISGKHSALIELQENMRGAEFDIKLHRKEVVSFCENLREATCGRAIVHEEGTWIC
jgi:putative IMPACT (imprinted ancient) family translation regulator